MFCRWVRKGFAGSKAANYRGRRSVIGARPKDQVVDKDADNRIITQVVHEM